MEIIKELGSVNGYKVNLMKWSNEDTDVKTKGVLLKNAQIIDIREWKDNIPLAGICLDIKDIITFLQVLFSGKQYNPKTQFKGKCNKGAYEIETSYGVVRKSNDNALEINRISWESYTADYDIRLWDKEHKKCSVGISTDLKTLCLITNYLISFADENHLWKDQ